MVTQRYSFVIPDAELLGPSSPGYFFTVTCRITILTINHSDLSRTCSISRRRTYTFFYAELGNWPPLKGDLKHKLSRRDSCYLINPHNNQLFGEDPLSAVNH